ncbi:HDOD domain-containing protein [Metasolibacillus sp.]|uniref:EAL and HDOD domain-containing protein n=1 Tax=Metasolibacillus sp. TaxID=2703680 RepID=UPI0025DB4294|nr:HDOD domain-containing protein [Metasolibacillus sp.]MCT6924629.1 HDOD domain-containing protein [Metasolibacillus sp.]MCT6940831.1 HDOD domain-containing protein [Metasolibacillus sp.]
MEVFIGRQPIFDEKEQIVSYELLYRSKNMNAFPLEGVGADAATIDVIINSFLAIGIDKATGGAPAFINFTEKLLFSPLVDYVNPQEVVIEILEDVSITQGLIERVKELKKKGFKLALDDFVLNDEVTVYDELFHYIDYIKVDFLITPLLKRMEIENKVKSKFPHIQLLAEKVETREQYEVAIHSGYVLFQGYFFEKPQIMRAIDIPANIINYFQIISILKDEEPDINILAENIEREISISYKLLQLINSSKNRKKSKIRSIKQAIVLLGLTELRKLVYLLAMRELNTHEQTDTFNELVVASLFRAKACEKVAKLNYKKNFSEYFLIGLLSLIDALLKRPMHLILRKMPLSEEIVQTINGVETEMTPYLQFSEALYKLDWDKLTELSQQLGLNQEKVFQIYDETEQWAREVIS